MIKNTILICLLGTAGQVLGDTFSIFPSTFPRLKLYSGSRLVFSDSTVYFLHQEIGCFFFLNLPHQMGREKKFHSILHFY